MSFFGELSDRDLLDVAKAVCAPRGLSVNELHRLHGGRGDRAVMAARRDFALHLRELGWSTPRIARLLGYKDHTSILHVQGYVEPASAVKP